MTTWKKHDLKPEDVEVLLIFPAPFHSFVMGKASARAKMVCVSHEDAMEMSIEAATENLIKDRDPKSKVGPRPFSYPAEAQAFWFGEKPDGEQQL